MDAQQDRLSNPFSMDEACANCPNLCETRRNVVHGYGDVAAEFLFVGERPSPESDRTGVPFAGGGGTPLESSESSEPEGFGDGSAGERLQYILGELGLSRSPPDAEEPSLQNVFLTHLTRCRHPERPPTDEEVDNCEPYLNAEIRMINPEIIVPIGQRALEELAVEYTTRAPESFDVDAEHATTVRGRGFELVPMVELDRQTETQSEEFVDHMLENVFARDYRQTKGRRSR